MRTFAAPTGPAVVHARRVLVLAVVLALAGGWLWQHAEQASARPSYRVPTSSQLETDTGVRFTRAAVVAHGGIVEITYVVLDSQKASHFQSDVKHPPRLTGERSRKVAWRTALMRQGHELRPGQTYYILYLNNGNGIRPGDTVQIDTGRARLAHVPVR
jgi:hypothetical protein